MPGGSSKRKSNQRFPCPKCKRSFNLDGNLLKHIRAKHGYNEAKKFRLNKKCSKYTKGTENATRNHYQCMRCEETFNRIGKLYYHYINNHDHRNWRADESKRQAKCKKNDPSENKFQFDALPFIWSPFDFTDIITSDTTEEEQLDLLLQKLGECHKKMATIERMNHNPELIRRESVIARHKALQAMTERKKTYGPELTGGAKRRNQPWIESAECDEKNSGWDCMDLDTSERIIGWDEWECDGECDCCCCCCCCCCADLLNEEFMNSVDQPCASDVTTAPCIEAAPAEANAPTKAEPPTENVQAEEREEYEEYEEDPDMDKLYHCRSYVNKYETDENTFGSNSRHDRYMFHWDREPFAVRNYSEFCWKQFWEKVTPTTPIKGNMTPMSHADWEGAMPLSRFILNFNEVKTETPKRITAQIGCRVFCMTPTRLDFDGPDSSRLFREKFKSQPLPIEDIMKGRPIRDAVREEPDSYIVPTIKLPIDEERQKQIAAWEIRHNKKYS